MEIGKWKFGWQRDLARETVSVALYQVNHDGSRDLFQKNGECVRVPPGEAIKEPSFTFSPDHLQAFMDGLWEMGVRPKEVRYERELDLLKDHLSDFKKLVFERRIK